MGVKVLSVWLLRELWEAQVPGCILLSEDSLRTNPNIA